VGIGSVAFHATLHRFSQALDEVPMLYCVMTYTFIAICQRYPISAFQRLVLGISLILYCALLTILVTVSHGPLQFALFHISFNSAHLFALFQAYKLYTDRSLLCKSRNSKKTEQSLLLFERGALFYFSSFMCWLADMFLCEYINPHYSTSYLPFNPQLHAWWHIFISIGLYCMGVLTLHERMEKKKGTGSSTIEYRWMILPCVVMSDRALSSPLLTRQRARENKLLF
jgi:dihydroceramidase